jgi:hypothetical protein
MEYKMKKFAVFIAFTFFLTVGLFAQQKFALVIGNGAYNNVTKLSNPVNDANDMEAALKGLGWTVDKVLNGTQDQMVNAIMQLKKRLSASRDSYGFLFYAGHGIQSNGENYLIPVDANIPSENFLRNRTVSVQEMLDELNDAGNEFNVVVLDACRDNPFGWKRSGSRGLSVVGQQPADSIIVFATSAGSTAADGSGRNGLFTSNLLNNLKQPDLEVTEVFRRTGADVARASNNQQRPAVYNQFYGTAYLGGKPKVATTQTTQPQKTGGGSGKSEAFDPQKVTQEQYQATIAEVQKFVEEQNKNIKSKNFEAWKRSLSPEYFAQISSAENLKNWSELPGMKTRNIVLRTAQDYFYNVVVPSSTDLHVKEIEFISANKVKAFTIVINKAGEEQRLRLYDLEKINNSWRIIN